MTTREPDHGHLGDRPSTDRPGATVTAEPEVEHRIKRAKTSAAAAIALAIGYAAFVLTLLVLFFPVALILGVIGLLLGIVGFRATKKPGVMAREWPSPPLCSARSRSCWAPSSPPGS